MRLHSTSGPWRGSSRLTCERAALLISRQIDGEIAPADERALRDHVARCRICRRMQDAQSTQADEITESLGALWNNDAPKRAEPPPPSMSFYERFRKHIPKLIAAASLTAAVIVYARTGKPPSANVAVAAQHSASHRIASQTPSSPTAIALVVPQKNNTVPSLETAAAEGLDDSIYAIELANAPAPDVADAGIDLDTALSVADAPIEPPFAAAPVIEETRVDTAPLASFSGGVPLKKLDGIVMKFALRDADGSTTSGWMFALGDVLNGHGAVRIQTNSGKNFEAAQAELDAMLPEPFRKIAKKFLSDCSTSHYQEKVKRAIDRLSTAVER